MFKINNANPIVEFKDKNQESIGNMFLPDRVSGSLNENDKFLTIYYKESNDSYFKKLKKEKDFKGKEGSIMLPLESALVSRDGKKVILVVNNEPFGFIFDTYEPAITFEKNIKAIKLSYRTIKKPSPF